MLIRLRGRNVPILLLAMSSIWLGAVVFPVSYSLLFPTKDIRHILRALEGRETPSGDLAPLVEQVTSSVGRLRRAIQVTAFFQISGEQKVAESHTTKTTELAYLAWFEKRSRPTIFVITRTEVDGSWLRFHTYEGTLFGTLRLYLLPATALGCSIYWLRRKARVDGQRLDAGGMAPRPPTVGR